LGQCEFLDGSHFTEGVEALKGLKIVIVGAGAQGLNQAQTDQLNYFCLKLLLLFGFCLTVSKLFLLFSKPFLPKANKISHYDARPRTTRGYLHEQRQ
jgi:hypothetical protein